MTTPISQEEQEFRRQAVSFYRSNLRLEGADVPEQLRLSQARYVAGDLSDTEYQTECIRYIRVLANNPSWMPPTP